MEELHYVYLYSLYCMLLYEYSSFSLDTVFSLAGLKVPGGHQQYFFCSPKITHHTEDIVFAPEMLTNYEVFTYFSSPQYFQEC